MRLKCRLFSWVRHPVRNRQFIIEEGELGSGGRGGGVIVCIQALVISFLYQPIMRLSTYECTWPCYDFGLIRPTIVVMSGNLRSSPGSLPSRTIFLSSLSHPFLSLTLCLSFFFVLSFSLSPLSLSPSSLSIFCLSVGLIARLSVGFLSLSCSLKIFPFNTHTHTHTLSLILCLSLSVSFSLSLYPSLSPSLSPSVCLSVSVSLFLCLSVSLSLCLCLSLSVSVYVSLSLSLSLILSLSLSPSLSPFLSPSLTPLSLAFFLHPFYIHIFCIDFSPSVSLSLSSTLSFSMYVVLTSSLYDWLSLSL